ncbi:MAG: hypothetical protein QOG85_1 [Gaiellaceae bacterium]|jgi:hypothetical protein|nr:hypothetical protein [Gaiellaceae bacterium]
MGRPLEMYPQPLNEDVETPDVQADLRVAPGTGSRTRAQGESRESWRSRRKRVVRARSISVKRIPKREIELGRALYPTDEHEDVQRPVTRADCVDGVRPCPFVSCAHHLYLDVSARTGAIKLNFPDLEPHELAESCSLDIADGGGATLERVGEIMNLTRERIRQVEAGGMAQMLASKEMYALRDFVEVGPVGKRHLPVLEHDEDEDDDQELAIVCSERVDHAHLRLVTTLSTIDVEPAE